MNRRFAIVHPVGVLLLFGLLAVPLSAKDPEPAVKKTFENLMKAIQENARAAFVANATDAVKDGTDDKIMAFMQKHLGTRLKEGYQATYLCELKQQGVQVHLWKLTFKDKGDDIVVRIGLRDGKVDGFFLQ